MSKATTAVARLVTANFKLKILAVIVAALSFLAIRGAIGFEVNYDVPVEVTVDQGVAILDQSPRVVQVMFRGSREDLLRIEQQRLKAVVKAVGSSPDGSERITIRTTDIQHGSPARVVHVRPDVVRLTFDHEITKTVPVARPALVGAPLVGRAELSYSPTTAQIKGPKRRVDTTVILATEPVDVTGMVESFTRKVRILNPSDAWVAHITPREVTADVQITVHTASRLLESIPVAALIPPGVNARVVVNPSRVTVRVSGSDKAVAALRASDIIAYVDCSDIKETTEQTRNVQVRAPSSGQMTIAVDPSTVQVIFQLLPESPAAPVADQGIAAPNRQPHKARLEVEPAPARVPETAPAAAAQ